MTPLIFLDIDGVLNNPGTWTPEPPSARDSLLAIPVHGPCMAALNRLIKTSGAQVVISSSWRMFAHWEHLGPALNRHGMIGEVIGETPRPEVARDWLLENGFEHDLSDALPRLYERGMEISVWLRWAWAEGSRSVADPFVILDDGSDMWKLKHHLVQTDLSVGLTEADVDRALALFETP